MATRDSRPRARHRCCALFGATCAVATIPIHAGDFADSGFELPVLPANSFDYDPNDPTPAQSPWTFVGNAGLTRPPSGFGSVPAAQGSQYAFLQSNFALPDAAVCQTISGLTVGEEHFFFARLATRMGCGTCTGPADVEFRLDGSAIATVPGPILPVDRFDPFVAFFVPSAASGLLCVVEPQQNFADASSFVDDVHVAQVRIFADGFEAPP